MVTSWRLSTTLLVFARFASIACTGPGRSSIAPTDPGRSEDVDRVERLSSDDPHELSLGKATAAERLDGADVITAILTDQED